MLKLRRYLRAEQGVTLVELLVVMVLLGLVGSVVMSSSIQALQFQATSTARMDAVHELEGAIQRVTRDLRAAEILQFPTDRNANAFIGADIRRDNRDLSITYGLEDVDGVQGLVQTVSEGEEQISERQLVTVLSDETTAVFRYLDGDGQRIACSDDHETCAKEYLRQAWAVAIRFERVVTDQEPVVVETVVNLRNVRYGGTT